MTLIFFIFDSILVDKMHCNTGHCIDVDVDVPHVHVQYMNGSFVFLKMWNGKRALGMKHRPRKLNNLLRISGHRGYILGGIILTDSFLRPDDFPGVLSMPLNMKFMP